jgi:hypothetical protein
MRGANRGAIIVGKEVGVMGPIAEAAEPPVRVLSPEESRAFFDAKVRVLLGVGGEEFVRRWNAGEYDEIADDPAHSDIMLFLPRDR